jgi:hypothetical protein
MVQSLSGYLRAHRRDPFFWLVVAFGITTGVAAVTVGRAYGPVAMAASLLFLNVTIGLVGGGLIFARCRRAWHAAAEAA